MAIGAVSAGDPNSVSAENRAEQTGTARSGLAFHEIVAKLNSQKIDGASVGVTESSANRAAGGRVQVEPDRTPLSGEQAASAIAQAYTEATGHPPTDATLAILTSHWSLETGQGARMFNYNFAGIKGTSPEGMTAVLKTREGWGANAVHIRDGFRAYSSAASGARDYVDLLVRRYGSALDAASAEDPAGFASQLKQGGYFTGNEDLYAKGITRLANRAMEYGANALGATAGALTSKPEVVNGYFRGAPNRAVAPALPGLYGGGRAPMSSEATAMMMRAPGYGVQAMADEITRAALAIAAERGAKS